MKSDATHKKKLNSSQGLLLLALSHAPILRKIEAFRRQFHIRTPHIVQTKEDAENLMDAHDALDHLMEQINLPRSSSVRHHFWNYVTRGIMGVTGATKYAINVDPPAEINSKGEVVSYSRSVSLVTFAKLTSVEERQALKSLKKMQEWVFHPNMLQKSPSIKNIETDLDVEKDMKLRNRPHKEERYNSIYLDLMSKQLERKEISPEQFKKIVAQNQHGVEQIIVGRTSKDVAKEKLGARGKDAVLRQRVSRLNKTRKKFFGE